ncbi:leucine-rich repeat and IQ domain-containing protein 1-like [Pomacea canaliculata]|uniref:leucine-rich repeat and IQ domain-containing protein 1-like n=1 Tax=Pomacea canaliculata TaxID=400727 RepID=UPI000D739439|nr:leucine-rich repeat and IQ domain-containing protein 1-like [Pomacea canaliculata]
MHYIMPPAGILQTEMDEDAVIEIEIQQELEGINLDENDELDLDNIEHEHIYGSDDDEDFCGPVKEPVNTNEEMFPKEMEEYLQMIKKQRLNFEQTLEECDAILTNSLNGIQGPCCSLVPYDDWKEIEEAAKQRGLSVDEFKSKLLEEIENDQYELEMLDISDDEDFKQGQEDRHEDEASFGRGLPAAERNDIIERIEDQEFEESETNPGLKDVSGAVVLAHSNVLLQFGHFLREQMELVEETYKERALRLKKELETKRAAEEHLLLVLEEQHEKILQEMEKEKQALAVRKEEMEKNLEKEKEQRQKILEQDLKQVQAEISHLTNQISTERHQLEILRKEEEERYKQESTKAAVTLQRWYRGYRTRKQHETICQKLTEQKEKRRAEMEKRRIEEVEKQIQKQKQEKIRIEEEEKLKREEERKLREKEKVCEYKQREEEEQRKKEEAKLKEEGKKAVEEEAIRLMDDKEKKEKGCRENDESSEKENVEKFNLLAEQIESCRLKWMKICLPWSKVSNEPWKQKLNVRRKKVPRRPSSSKKLPPLLENTILAAGKVPSLRQVTALELCDLPGHSLSTLEGCLNLKHLKLTRCGIISLEHLSQCQQLQCIDVQENLIEFVDLKDLNNLYMLNLSHNKLTSIHGLDSCTRLCWLNLAHNKLTQLDGLSPLRHLHTLLVSNNQLVSTEGLDLCPTIQHLDLSGNYLTAIKGVEKLGLLLELDASSNNLSEMPDLQNQVLLQRLILRENSIGPHVDLSAIWLPLLTHLDLSQNVIEELKGPSYGLFTLKFLDLAVNQIVDSSQVLPALSACFQLEDLNLQGNVAMDEENISTKAKSELPLLRCLNSETVRTLSGVSLLVHKATSFEITCLQQTLLHKDLKQTRDRDSRIWTSEGTFHMCDAYFNFCDKSFKIAVEHRYTHEYGELASVNIPFAPQTPRSSSSTSMELSKVQQPENMDLGAAEISLSSPENKNSKTLVQRSQEKLAATVHQSQGNLKMTGLNTTAISPRKPSSVSVTAKEKFEMALRGKNDSSPSTAECSLDTSQHCQSPPLVVSHRSQEHATFSSDKNSSPKITLPALNLSGEARNTSLETRYYSSQLSSIKQSPLIEKEKYADTMHHTDITRSEARDLDQKPLLHDKDIRGVGGQLDASDLLLHETSNRQWKLASSNITADTVGVLMKSSGDDNFENLDDLMDGLQFDIDGFLDLEQFSVDEDLLEKGWRPEESPQIPSSYPVLAQIPPGSASGKPPLPPVPYLHLAPGSDTALAQPPGLPSQAWYRTETPVSDLQARQIPRPPSTVMSCEDSQAAPTGRSRREEKLAEEWGFKDSRTAELMLQRAKKMKYNAERRKRISKLDPHQRLKLFHKLKEISNVHSVRPPPAHVLPRKEYFQAQKEEAQQRELEKQAEVQTKKGRTYEWLHTQVGDFDVSSSRINPGSHAGEHVMTLTSSDSDLSRQQPRYQRSPDLTEFDSASNIGRFQLYQQAHRHSISGDSSSLSSTSQTTVLPPIKVGSDPNKNNREKISWRTEPVNKSIGWGGGKKRTTNN